MEQAKAKAKATARATAAAAANAGVLRFAQDDGGGTNNGNDNGNRDRSGNDNDNDNGNRNSNSNSSGDSDGEDEEDSKGKGGDGRGLLSGMMAGRCWVRVLGWLVVVAMMAVAVVGFVVLAPFGPRAERFVEIAAGTSTEGIGVELERAGVIRSRYGLDLLRVVKGGRLKAGEYRFDHPASLAEVYARLRRGDVYTVTVSVPEGYNVFDIATAVQLAGLADHDAFLAAERAHTELLAGVLPVGATRPASLEGFLFPDTYRFSRHATPEAMLGAMVRRFRVAQGQMGLRPAETMRVVTLASLVEKEVRAAEERPLVAGVFANRLRRGMPLQTDPTVIYAALLEQRYRGTIYASDLQSASAYNTYRHAGLPPGPIANPGMNALRAAMHPAATDYLYFVSDAAGHSRFSADLGEHGRQVEAYRKAAKP